MTDEEFNRIQWAVQGREGVGQGSEKRAVTAQRGRSMTRKQRIKVRQMCPFLIRGGQYGYLCSQGGGQFAQQRLQCDINCERLNNRNYE